MKHLQIVYWLRLGLGIVAALLCIGYGIATDTITNDLTKITFNTFMNGMSIALVTYLVSYYIIKRKFTLTVEKPKKLVTMGIGIYFLAWLVFWILLYTLIAGPPQPA